MPFLNDDVGYIVRYYKGPLMLDFFRNLLGDGEFFKICRDFFKTYSKSLISTPDFRHFWKERLGVHNEKLDLWLDSKGGLPDLEKGYRIISAEALLAKISQGEKTILIDCRPEEEYRAGHIPGALNVSVDSYAFGKETAVKAGMNKILNETGKTIHFILVDLESGEEYMPKIKLEEIMKILPENRSQEIIFYCRRPDCTRSPMASRWAVALGYKNVFRYEGSWKDWTEKKYPVEK